MAIKQVKFNEWKGVKLQPIKQSVWSPKARRATLLIEMTDKQAYALLVDDAGGVRAQLAVTPDKVGELIASTSQAWLGRGAIGSLAVMTSLRGKGEISPPPIPPTGPGPVGDEVLRAAMTMMHAKLEGVAEVAANVGRMAQFRAIR